MARRIHADPDRTHDPREGDGARAAAPPRQSSLRDRHLHQRLHRRADRARLRRRSTARDRARSQGRKVHRKTLGNALFPPGQGDTACGMARRSGPDARVVFRELVLQRLAERPAAARARDAPGGGGPRRDPAPGSERARLAGHQPGMKTVPVLIVALVPASLALATAFGSVDLGPGQLADALLGRGDEIAREIVWGVRAPRALAGFACGGLLALAGALLQVLLRNPLADPAILGLAGGAAAGAPGAMLPGAGAAPR